MVNIPCLLKILNTKKLSELVANIDLPPLDLNLLIWDAEKAGEIEVNLEKDKVTALTEPEITFDSDLASKLLRTLQHYEVREINATRGRLNSLIKDPSTGEGYPYHEYLLALNYLTESGQVIEMPVEVPKTGKRLYKKFVFLCFPDNDNETWNKKEVNNFIANWNKK